MVEPKSKGKPDIVFSGDIGHGEFVVKDGEGKIWVHQIDGEPLYYNVVAEGVAKSHLWVSALDFVISDPATPGIVRLLLDTSKATDKMDMHGFFSLLSRLNSRKISTIKFAVVSSVDEAERKQLLEEIAAIYDVDIDLQVFDDLDPARAWIVL